MLNAFGPDDWQETIAAKAETTKATKKRMVEGASWLDVVCDTLVVDASERMRCEMIGAVASRYAVRRLMLMNVWSCPKSTTKEKTLVYITSEQIVGATPGGPRLCIMVCLHEIRGVPDPY